MFVLMITCVSGALNAHVKSQLLFTSTTLSKIYY